MMRMIRRTLSLVLVGMWVVAGLAQPVAPVDSPAIMVDGSSTVGPLTEAVAADFLAQAPRARISVGVGGTSGGFRRLLAGETDINNASRPIRPAEMTTARDRGIEYIELMVGMDSVTVAVSRESRIFRNGAPVMTLGELNLLWSRESEGLITRWNQISPRFADAPIVLSGPSSASGTFDVFTTVVSGRAGDSRADYFGTEEDQLLAEQTGADPYALTYFGFAYLVHNRGRVQAVALDPRPEVIDTPPAILAEINARRAAAGKAPIVAVGGTPQGIVPTEDTIADFSYPLSRMLFFYINAASSQRPLVQAFVNFYLSEEVIGDPEFMLDVGYHSISFELREAARAIWTNRITGTAFGGTIVGFTPAEIVQMYRRHAGL